MKARKLKSGNWNIQVFDYRDDQGKAHYTSFTAPTKYEVEYKAALYRKEHPIRTSNHDMTVGSAVDRYIELCGTLSPTTSTNYLSIRKTAFQELMDVPVKKLSNEILQKAINKECLREINGKPVSAKTVKNAYGLISASLKKVCDLSFVVSLPKVKRQLKQYPDPQDVIRVIMDSDIKLPCLLSIWCTFSMSELLGIRCSDISESFITINHVLVWTKDGTVEKDIAKNSLRNRVHQIPCYIKDLIWQTDTYKRYLETGADDHLISMPRTTLAHKWKRLCKANDLDMTFHDLRHMSASIMLRLNIPDKYAQERGGWATSNVMKTVYQHTFSTERIAVDRQIDEYFEKSLNKLSERPCEKP